MSSIPLKEEYRQYTAGLVLFDLVPVFLFFLSGLVIRAMYGSTVFLAGVLASFAGGMCKVIWKFIVVRKGRDVTGLTKAFRVLMFGGFGLMALAVVISAASDSGRSPAGGSEVISGNPGSGTVFEGFLHAFTIMPATIFFIAGIAGMCAMGYLGTHMDKSARSNWIEEITNALSQLAILIGVVIVYFGYCYQAGEAAKAALQSTDKVAVTESEQGYCFDGPGTQEMLVFYQGAKVEEAAYAPLLSSLAGQGVDCYLCKMPYNCAIFDKDLAEDIRAQFAGGAPASSEGGYANWYIAGHSLGGAMAADYLTESAYEWKGMIFLGSYPATKVSIPALLICATEDGLATRDKIEKAAAEGLWPDNLTRYTIYGGNHAGFGCYGAQKGDGTAVISQEEQQRQTASMIIEWIRDE